MIANIKAKKLTHEMVNKDMVENMSQSLNVGINYFCLNKNEMIFQIRQNQ